MENSTTQQNHWQEFRDVLKERLRTPTKHPTFMMYFWGIIVILGAVVSLESVVTSYLLSGKWTEIESIRMISALYTYSVAIAATAAADLVLSLREPKYLLMLSQLSCVAVGICAVLAAHLGTLALALFGYILALFLWWVGNANNATLLDTPSKPDVTTGGDTQDQPVGDLSDFNT